MKSRNYEWLTEAICLEYKQRAEMLPSNAGQDIGEWRELRLELQIRCNVTEVEAYNILRGGGTEINSNGKPAEVGLVMRMKNKLVLKREYELPGKNAIDACSLKGGLLWHGYMYIG